jgi:hypothetical protein
VADWSGHSGVSTAGRYRSMAEQQLHGISPSYERLCLGVAADAELLGRLDTLPTPKRQPNLLLAAVRYLDGPIGSYRQFRGYVLDRWDEVAAVMRARRTQTNEPHRCAVLLPVLASLLQPLALLEVGASAGLCLYPDRYAYRYGDGDVVGTAPVVFDCAVRGPVPIPERVPEIAWRAGLDLNPLDVTDDDDLRWLESLIWPEEGERFVNFRQAIAAARPEAGVVRPGDLTTDLAGVAAEAPADASLVVFHSAVLSYLTDEERARFRGALAAVRADRPVVWVSNEGPRVVVDVPVPEGTVPFVLARDETPLGYAAPHGASLEWLG